MINKRERDLNYIKDRIKFYTGLDVRTDTRKREYVYARIIFNKILREHFMMTMSTIANYLGRSHASIVHSMKNFETIEKYEPNFYKVYQYILLEMESEQIVIGKKPMGEKQDIDKDVLKVREAIKKAIDSLQIV
jgi:predicted transcriptional regulator